MSDDALRVLACMSDDALPVLASIMSDDALPVLACMSDDALPVLACIMSDDALPVLAHEGTVGTGEGLLAGDGDDGLHPSREVPLHHVILHVAAHRQELRHHQWRERMELILNLTNSKVQRPDQIPAPTEKKPARATVHHSDIRV